MTPGRGHHRGFDRDECRPAPLARLLLGRGHHHHGAGVSGVFGGTCTAWAWDGTAPATNTVVASSTTFTNLPALNPAAMSIGRVLLINGPAGPIILGRLSAVASIDPGSGGPGSDTGGDTGGDPGGGDNTLMIDALAQEFTASNGQTGNYHRYAANLSPSATLGLCVQLHGDGFAEYSEPTTPGLLNYSITGIEGIWKQALYRNMITVVARTPDEATGTWWEAGDANSVYLRDLINQVIAQYPNISRSKIWLVGYSGGSQQIAQYFMPSQSDTLWGGGAMIFGGGGLPATTEEPYSAGLLANFPMKWWTGTADDGTSDEHSPGFYDALTDSHDGSAHYETEGFPVYLENPDGLDHMGADTRFGAIWGRFLHQVGFAPVTATGTAARASTTTITWTGTVQNAPAVTLRASATAFGTQIGFYEIGAVDLSTRTATVTVDGLTPGVAYFWRLEIGGNEAHGSLLASGTIAAAP